MDITYTDSISADEFNFIRASVGFRQFHPEQAEAEIHGSTRVIAAYHENAVVGMARLLWSGGVSASASVLVIPAFQNQGLEEEMMDRFFRFLKEQLKPGFGIQVDVRAFGRQQELYEKLGFQVSAVEQRGIPMHLCLTQNIELTDNMFRQSISLCFRHASDSP